MARFLFDVKQNWHMISVEEKKGSLETILKFSNWPDILVKVNKVILGPDRNVIPDMISIDHFQ